jgi:AcrR family transcriptional regulator
MTSGLDAKQRLLEKTVRFAEESGITDKSLREIAAGAGTSHRMLLYHFGSREGLLAAIATHVTASVVRETEARQRSTMAALSEQAGTPRQVMLGLWEQLTAPETLPFVRLFFEVFGLAARGAPGTEALLASLTGPWLDDGAAAAARLGYQADPAAMRLGVAVARGLLLDLVAGADRQDVDDAYRLFVDLFVAGMEHRRSTANDVPNGTLGA